MRDLSVKLKALPEKIKESIDHLSEDEMISIHNKTVAINAKLKVALRLEGEIKKELKDIYAEIEEAKRG